MRPRHKAAEYDTLHAIVDGQVAGFNEAAA